uniref:Uncharacterized protein n=1 Tax=Arundo donax TaxID=35708 RepID=A0A0A9BXM2_ARUDO
MMTHTPSYNMVYIFCVWRNFHKLVFIMYLSIFKCAPCCT